MSKFLLRYTLLFLGIILLGCSQQPQELKTAESLIETAPDSALHILQNLSPNKFKSGANRALYGLLMIQTLDKKLLPLKPDSLLDYSISYYEQNHERDRLASCYLYKGRTYKNLFQYEKAVVSYLKALDELKNYQNNLLLGRINSDLGDIYCIQSDNIKSRQKYILAFENFNKAKSTTKAFYALIDIGITYCNTKNYSTALKYFRRVVTMANDSLTKGAALDEMGSCYYKSLQYDSALFYMKKAINYPYLGYNRAMRYYYLSKLYFDLKKVDSSFVYASNALRLSPPIRTQRECYRIMANCDFRRKHFQNVTSYMNKYVALSESIRKIDAQTKGSVLESKHYSDLKYEKTRRVLWYSIGFIILIMGASWLLYTYLHKKTTKEKEKIHAMHLQQKTNMHKEVIVNHREVLQNKIQERKNMLAAERKIANQVGKIAIDRKVYEELLHINDTEYFYDEMNSVFNNLVNKLNNLYPNLTPREVMWCCLSLLQVPSTDMYMLLDTNVDSLKKMKQRLAPKFNLILVSELENYLIELVSE